MKKIMIIMILSLILPFNGKNIKKRETVEENGINDNDIIIMNIK